MNENPASRPIDPRVVIGHMHLDGSLPMITMLKPKSENAPNSKAVT